VQLRYQYRIYPGPGQRRALARTFGCARVVYNDALSIREQARTAGLAFVSSGELSKRLTATRYGRTFGKVDRWFPSSKLCSSCGALQDKMPLNIRTWTCSCGTTHDRDHNAAKNVLAAGQAERLNACGDQVRPAPGLAQVSEAGTHPQRTTHLAWEQTGIPGL